MGSNARARARASVRRLSHVAQPLPAQDNGRLSRSPPYEDQRAALAERAANLDETDQRASAKRGAGLAVYTMEEVAQHSSPDDCWLVANGKVYDVTSFLSSHPAGAQAILRHAGKDSSEDFGFHSERAKGLWEKLLVGRVEGAASDGDSACVVM